MRSVVTIQVAGTTIYLPITQAAPGSAPTLKVMGISHSRMPQQQTRKGKKKRRQRRERRIRALNQDMTPAPPHPTRRPLPPVPVNNFQQITYPDHVYDEIPNQLNNGFLEHNEQPIYQEIHDLLQNVPNWQYDRAQISPFARDEDEDTLFGEITPIELDDSDWEPEPMELADPFPDKDELCRRMEDLGIDLPFDDDDDDELRPRRRTVNGETKHTAG